MTGPVEVLQIVGNHMEVTWNGKTVRYPARWLRDHCHAAHSMNPETNQRQVDTFAIPFSLAPKDARLSKDEKSILVTWPNEDKSSIYPLSFLEKMADAGSWKEDHPKVCWKAEDLIGGLPTVCYDAVMDESDLGLLKWMELIDLHGFALVSDVPSTPEATEALARRIAYIRETIFGGFWDFTANQAFADTAYSTVEIGPHTDGTYAIDSPGYQMFHCLEFDGIGGESIFVDGFKVAEEIQRHDEVAYTVLTETPVPAQYLGDGVHLMAEHPIIGLDRDGSFLQVAYNNYDRAPFRLEDEDQEIFYRGLTLFNQLINDPAYQIRFGLRPGTVVLFDNWRVLHAREAYQGHRRLCGAYLNKEDFLSKLRVLRNG